MHICWWAVPAVAWFRVDQCTPHTPHRWNQRHKHVVSAQSSWLGRVHISCMEDHTMPWDAPPHSVLCTLDEPVSRMISCFLMGKINAQNDNYIVTRLPKRCAAYDQRQVHVLSAYNVWFWLASYRNEVGYWKSVLHLSTINVPWNKSTIIVQ